MTTNSPTLVRPLITMLALVAALIAGLVSMGCKKSSQQQQQAPANNAATSAPEGKKPVVCFLPKKKGVPYFTSCAQGAQEAADELGVELIYDGPTDGSPEKAASMIERWTLQGVSAIAVSPNDPEALAPAMRQAQSKGIKVITWDADGAKDARGFFVNQATSQQIGYALVDTMVKDLAAMDEEGKGGEVAIITASLTAANQNEWIRAMKERLEAHPELKLVDIRPSNEDQAVAFQAAKDLMNAYPNLKGIWGISSVSFPAAAEAVKQAGKGGKVLVTGLSTPNDMKAYVHDGTVKSVILWNTRDLGYLTVHAAAALILGQGLQEGASQMQAGRLGAVKVEGDNVMLGDILVFTKENIDQFDF